MNEALRSSDRRQIQKPSGVSLAWRGEDWQHPGRDQPDQRGGERVTTTCLKYTPHCALALTPRTHARTHAHMHTHTHTRTHTHMHTHARTQSENTRCHHSQTANESYQFLSW